ncbi:hypothetical protein PG999_007766 [Apiospora kogelbergensis]|uniref:Tetratricopeptide repeat-containing protein n=1 Tax=Apiospora kogelbergensis TaxID=1337665 RepID=A0AAW0QSX1_9PEZI
MSEKYHPEHPDRLEAKAQLIQTYYIQSRFRDAYHLAKSLVKSHMGLLGSEDQRTLRSWCLLAELDIAMGNYVKAEKCLMFIVRNAHNVNGKTHPETLRYETLLAFVSMRAGKLDRAFNIARDVLITQSSTCFAYENKKGPGGRKSVVRINKSLPVADETELQAIAFLETVISSLEGLTFDEVINPSVIMAIGVMGLAGSTRFDSMEWHKKWRETLQAMLDNVMSPLGPSPPLLALIYKVDMVSSCLEATDKDDESACFGVALEWLKNAYQDKCHVLGRDDPSTKSTRRDLIASRPFLLMKWQDPDLDLSDPSGIETNDMGQSLITELKRIVVTHEASLGDDHPETLKSLVKLFFAQCIVGESRMELDNTLTKGLRRLREGSSGKQWLVESLVLQSEFANAIGETGLGKEYPAFASRAMNINQSICDTIDRAPASHDRLPSQDLSRLRKTVAERLARQQRDRAEALREHLGITAPPAGVEGAGPGRVDGDEPHKLEKEETSGVMAAACDNDRGEVPTDGDVPPDVARIGSMGPCTKQDLVRSVVREAEPLPQPSLQRWQ